MKQKEKQEIFDFFTDILTKASQEFQNKVKESKIYAKIQKELDKYIRIPVSEFATQAWFEENGWETGEFPGVKKDNYKIFGPINMFKNNKRIKGPIYLISELVKDDHYQTIFQGKIQNEKEFFTLMKMLDV